MGTGASWYKTGFDGIGQEEQRIASLSGPSRLWVPPGTGRSVVLIDDDPFCIYEHNAKINGNWRNWHTCLKGGDSGCISCTQLGERSRYYIGYLSGVDCTQTTDKKGNKYQYEVKLVGGKLGLLKKWRRKKEDRTTMVMTTWKVFREDGKKPGTGDEWEYERDVDKPDKLFEVANYRGKKLSDLYDKAEAEATAMTILKRTFQVEFDDNGKLLRRVFPFNYMEVLAPKTPEFLKDMIRGASLDDSSGGDGGSGGGEEDVPF